MKTSVKNHKHTWIVASIAIIFAVAIIIFLPKNKSYSLLMFGLAGGHVLIALIAAFTGWILIPQGFLDKIWKKKAVVGYDFGWAPKWLYAFVAASLIVLFLAVYVFFQFQGSEVWQLLWYSLIFLFAVNLFIGFVVLQNSKRQARITLPMVTLLKDGRGIILDAGCGAGRTTIAVSEGYPLAQITSFDRFDADYIDEGGIKLLKKNIKIAGIESRTTITKGDITASTFPNNHFDAIISSYMFDHLGPYKKKALEESLRILKPGGRFLLIIAVRGYSTFGLANVLCLLLPSRKTWKKWIEDAGFKMVSDGKINEGAYFCFEKPL